MKLLSRYALLIILSPSLLVAGPKLTERFNGSLSQGADCATLNEHDLNATYVAEDGHSSLDASSNSREKGEMESPLSQVSLIKDYFSDSLPPGAATPNNNALFGNESIEVIESSSTTHDLDQQLRLVEQTIAKANCAKATLQRVSEEKANSFSYALQSKLANFFKKIHTSKRVEAAMQDVQETQEDLDLITSEFGAEQPEQLFGKIEEDPNNIIIFDPLDGCKETAPIAQSFLFGQVIKKQFEQLQNKTIVNKLNGEVSLFGKRDPFEDMLADVKRAHEGKATYSLDEGTTTIFLGPEKTDNLDAFKNFVGKNESLQIAIASVMHQGAQSDFESIKLKAPRDATEPDSNSFFVSGANNKKVWQLNMEGPLTRKLFTRENSQETQTYNLDKLTSVSGAPIFQLTTTCTQSIENNDFKYDLARYVIYEFKENDSFHPNKAISEDNSPITVSCLEGKIVQSFDDKRTPEQFEYQRAEYNLAVYQKRLAAFGNPEEIEAAHQERMRLLGARAPFRSGFVMAQDLKKEDDTWQAFQKAQQDVRNAEQNFNDAEKAFVQRHSSR